MFRVLLLGFRIRPNSGELKNLLSSSERRSRAHINTQKQTNKQTIKMGRAPVRLKEVVYGISSNKAEIMGSLGRDAFSTIAKKVGGGWFDVTVFGIAPVVGTVMCVYNLSFSYLFFSSLYRFVFLKRGRRVSGRRLLLLL